MVKVEIDAALVEEARQLDAQSSLNRSNIQFSRLSQKIARQLLSSAVSSNTPNEDDLLKELERLRDELATRWNSSDTSDKPPFCCVEGVAYAINACKMRSITGKGHVAVTVPFYCEFERGRPYDLDKNPNGEESPVQKLEEALFLLEYSNNDQLSMELIFVNDAIAEKKDDQDGGGSARLFQKAILEYANQQGLKIETQTAAPDNLDSTRFTLLDGRLGVTFTSCEMEAR